MAQKYRDALRKYFEFCSFCVYCVTVDTLVIVWLNFGVCMYVHRDYKRIEGAL